MSMSGLPTYYAQEMLNLHAKFGLSQNARTLLRAHDDWKLGRIDQAELGRLLRMSPNMRKAVTDTITKCANIMKKKPEESKMCIDIIQACTEILVAREEPPSMNAFFPFMKLPYEVRRNVYQFYVKDDRFPTSPPGVGAVTHPKISWCDCPAYSSPVYPARTFHLALARTCKKIRDEFLDFFYGTRQLHFTCTCELYTRLQNSELLRILGRKIKIHWTGPDAKKGFLLLAKCEGVRELEVVLSKSTTIHLNPREKEMQKFFAAERPPRLTDALGMDQLLKVRGVDVVTVSHQSARQGSRRNEVERASLQAMLRTKLKLPRKSEEGGN